MSANGVQQGDPAGPAFFCLAMKQLSDSFSSELKVCYLDDITLGGDLDDVLVDVRKVLDFEATSGLTLNADKCELVILNPPSRLNHSDAEDIFRRVELTLPGIQRTGAADLELLGAPLLQDALEPSLRRKFDKLKTVCDRLLAIHPQQALFLLRHCLFTPRIIHILRTASTAGLHVLEEMQEYLKQICERVLNVRLSARLWEKAFLPLSAGGLAVRSPTDLADICYTSSFHASANLMKAILPEEYHNIITTELTACKERHKQRAEYDIPVDLKWHSQKAIDSLFVEQRFQRLLQAADNLQEAARMRASRHAFSSLCYELFQVLRWAHY